MRMCFLAQHIAAQKLAYMNCLFLQSLHSAVDPNRRALQAKVTSLLGVDDLG